MTILSGLREKVLQYQTDNVESLEVAAPPKPVVRLEHINKSYGRVQAVKDLTTDIRPAEVFTLLGPSGCGKSTTLRLLAGLEVPDSGDIYFDEKPIVSMSRKISVPPHKRKMGMVFQSYAVWPHLTVFENVAFPLKARGVKSSEIRDRVGNVLQLVGMDGLEDRPAPKLSGGQQQRVALARALVYEPRLLLLDEPFSNLDTRLREQMRLEVKLIQRRVGIAVLLVTHDQIEALSLSDRLAVMKAGTMEQVGSPEELYSSPATPFVRDFLGKVFLLPAHVSARRDDGWTTLELDGGSTTSCWYNGPESVQVGDDVVAAIRPEHVKVSDASLASGNHHNCLMGDVLEVVFVGDSYECILSLGPGQQFTLKLPSDEGWKHAKRLMIHLRDDCVTLWPKS